MRRISICVLLFQFPIFAEEFCELQPDGFDNSRQSALDFEKNIEDKISEIYRIQYPRIAAKFSVLEELQKQLADVEDEYIRKYAKPVFRHPKTRTVDRTRKKKRKDFFLKLAETDIRSESGLDNYLKDVKIVHPIPYDAYREYINKVRVLKVHINEVNTSLLEIQSFGFFQLPDFGFSLRGDQSYGHLKMEGLFRVPKDDLLRLPFLKIGFETNVNTLIYACIHLDEFAPEKNRVYIYFLNTTKLYAVGWKDFFVRPKLVIRHLLTFNRKPRAVISPLPFVLNPLAAASETFNNLGQIQRLSNYPSFNQIMSAAGRFNFLNFSANLNPILLAIKNNVRIGIQGIVIHSDKLQIRYAGSALYGLINFNLAVHNQSADFSSFMNIMTLDSDL